MRSLISRLFIIMAIACSAYGTEPVRVYVDVVGDLFHYGHVEILRKAKSYGDILVVGVHSDEAVMTYKRRPVMTLEERVRSVQACPLVDEVIPHAPLKLTYDYIEEHDIHLVIHGDDISEEVMNIWYKVPLELGILRLVPYTEEISTTKIIERIVNRRDLVEKYLAD